MKKLHYSFIKIINLEKKMYRLLTQACAHHNSRFRDKTHWKQSPIKQMQPCFSAVNLTQNLGRDNAQSAV